MKFKTVEMPPVGELLLLRYPPKSKGRTLYFFAFWDGEYLNPQRGDNFSKTMKDSRIQWVLASDLDDI